MPDSLDGHLHFETVPTRACRRSTVASAMSRFSVGDHVVDVAFPDLILVR